MIPTATHPPTVEGARDDLLGRLGLDDTASSEDVAAAHEAVESFLASAPRQLGAWARRQASSADEAYALLTDPAALARTVALGARANRPAMAPGGPATPPARREPTPPPPPARSGRRGRIAAAAGIEAEPTDDELAALIASVTPSAHRDSVGAAERPAPAGGSVDGMTAPPARRGLRARLALGAGGVAVLAVVAFAGYHFGGGGVANALPAASAAPSSSIDLAAVNSYMQRIAANPKDTDALQRLADLYYGAGDYTSAADFLDRILAYDTSNVRALLGLGAAAFNNGDSTAAETAWKKVVAIDPKSVEAHYDLGFLYLNLNDIAGVRREWELVIQLDPGSDVAKNVQDHLSALAAQASPAPSSSGVPSAVPSAGASATPGTSGQP